MAATMSLSLLVLTSGIVIVACQLIRSDHFSGVPVGHPWVKLQFVLILCAGFLPVSRLWSFRSDMSHGKFPFLHD